MRSSSHRKRSSTWPPPRRSRRQECVSCIAAATALPSALLRINEKFPDGHPSGCQLLLECGVFEGLYGGQIWLHPKRQRIIANDFRELTVFLIAGGIGLSGPEPCEPQRFRLGESIVERFRNPWVRLEDFVLHHDGAVHGID